MSVYQSINIVHENGEESTGHNLPYNEEEDTEKNHLLKLSKPESKVASKKCLLSVYVLMSTLFFGFAVGFSVGFYVVWIFASEMNLDRSSLSIAEFMESLKSDILKKLFPDDSLSLRSTMSSLKLPPYEIYEAASRQPLYLNRADAYGLLLSSTPLGSSTISPYSNDFFQISSGLDVQLNQDYCGAATAVAILNSLRYLRNDGVEIPVDSDYAPYSYATQSDIFGKCTEKNVIHHLNGIDGITTPPHGLNIEQVAQVLRCHLDGGTWSVDTYHLDKTHMTVGKVKYDLKNALIDPSSRVLVNYNRTLIGQTGGGHWSPVGSYSEKWDAFLIVDVAKYKYPPVWIPAERLYDAMATDDDCGSWDYPDAQDKLNAEEQTGNESASVYMKLGCKKKTERLYYSNETNVML